MLRILITLVFIFRICTSVANETPPHVLIIATGGTIAGTASSQTATTYKAGSLTAQELIASVSGLDKLAQITYQQIYNKDSADVTLSDWRTLASSVQQALMQKDIAGIVITHGTDTLEETAFFLSLIISSDKPIVLVGSMRPATSLSADGPLNLYNAVAVAASPDSENRGVLVVMNEQIHVAAEVTKVNTTEVQAFQSPNSGPIGQVQMGQLQYNNPAMTQRAGSPRFAAALASQFPEVAIAYEYAGANPVIFENLLNTPELKGLVIAGVGDGNIPASQQEFLKQAKTKGIVIVRSSRVGSGYVTYDYNALDTTYGLVSGSDLNPQKSRILLMLCLMKTNEPKKIQEYFNAR